MNLTRNEWPLGWIPSADEKADIPGGLLRADNLCLDEEGILSLCKGVANYNPTDFGSSVHSVYSKNILTTKFRFVGLSDATVRYSTNGSTWNNLLTGGSATRAAFSHALGHVFCFSGNERKKFSWDGINATITKITPGGPTAPPVVTEAAKNDFFFVQTTFTDFSLIEGQNFVNNSNYVEAETSNQVGIIEKIPASPWNTMTLGAGGVGQPTDQLLFYVRISDTSKLRSIRLIFNLTSSYSPLTDYFWYQWDNDSLQSTFNAGIDAWTALKCLRQDFNREGSKPNTGWQDVKSLRIIAVAESGEEVTFRVAQEGIVFVGYNENPLNSSYQYIQVNVNDTGAYIAKSVPGPISNVVTLVNGRARITAQAPTDSQVNQVWIYRRDASYLNNVQPIDGPVKLDRWYRVKVLTSNFSTPFEDYVSDEEALILGQTITDDVFGISGYTDDEIFGVSGLFNGRVVYMGNRDIYFSVLDDPGLYRPHQTVRLSGNSSEKNLWICNGGPNQLLVGTTHDIYEISGTGEDLPDGSINISIHPLGIGYPPISRAFAKEDNMVVYIASDGVRALNGVNSIKLSAQLDRLFEGQTRHGFVGFSTQPNDQSLYSLAFSKSKLFVAVPRTDSSRHVVIYDLKNRIWFPWSEGPNVLFREEDDTLIGGYPGYLKVMWVGSTAYPVNFRTTFEHNGQPRNRKDSFTFKLTLDTGNVSITPFIAKDGGSPISLPPGAHNGKYERILNIAAAIGFAFSYQIRFEGSNLTTFKPYNYTIEYEPRPEQLNYYRIANSNLGTISRKRFNTFPFIIDTLGNNVTFTPYVDNVPKPASTVNFDYVGTHIHYFTTNVEGVDIGGVLSGGPFEFYSALFNESVFEKIPAPTKYLRIPDTNFGTPNKKRVRTIPMVLNTKGNNVTFTPIVDGVPGTPTVFNTTYPQTVFHYFVNDSFGIDYGGILEGDYPFEFYEFKRPEIVDILPMGKKFDQVGPVQFNRLGRLLGFRIKVLTGSSTLPYKIYLDELPPFIGVIDTQPNELLTYEVMRLPKNYIGTICRIEFGPVSEVFHRYSVELHLNLSGYETQKKVIAL